jgi:histidyl-tRNA synthetase
MERQNEVRQELRDYIESINGCFEELEHCIEEKRKEITKIIEQFYRASAGKLIEAEQSAQEEIGKLEEMIKILSNKAEKLDSSSLCLFYYEKKDILQGIMEEGNSVYEGLKKLAPDLKWVVNTEVF